MRLAVSGGGTGGHISPAIAVAEALAEKNPKASVAFLATPRPVDALMYRKYEGSVHVLDPPRLDGGLRDIALFPFRALREYRRAKKLLRRLGSSILFSTGGYSSFFPVLAARSLRIPSVIHESNSVPGRANRLAARFADRMLTGFRSASEGFRGPCVHTGNPVRPSMRKRDRRGARMELGVPDGMQAVLFLGGSQGAMALNDIAAAVPEDVFLVLQCGERDRERASSVLADRDNTLVLDFVDDPSLLYSAADLAVARSGAMTVAELTWFRVPAVYVPYPHAADDHQTGNAREIADRGGALLARQEDIDTQSFWKLLRGLLEDDTQLDAMRDSLREIMPVNPAGLIADILMELGGGD